MVELRCNKMNKKNFKCNRLLFKYTKPIKLNIKCGNCKNFINVDIK